MKKLILIFLSLFIMSSCKQDEINQVAGMFAKGISELNAQKIQHLMSNPEKAIEFDYFYSDHDFTFEEFDLIQAILNQPSDVGKKEFINDQEAIVYLEYEAVDPDSIHPQSLQELTELINNSKKSEKVTINLPLIVVDNQWKVDIDKLGTIYQPLFDLYQNVDYFPKNKKLIPY